MNKEQRYKHEMLVRVREFGAEHRDLFPESTPSGGKFTRVAAMVAAVEEHMKNRALGRAGARRVKVATRAEVIKYLMAIVRAGQRVTGPEGGVNPFRMPQRRSLKGDIATARAFLEEAARREDRFVEFGLPATFISDLTALVNELEGAVNSRLNSKTLRAHAQAGIVSALREGLDLARDLDVVVKIATAADPVLAATWATARRIEGQKSSSSEAVDKATPTVTTDASPPTADAPSPPAAPEVTPDSVTTVQAPALVLEKAS